MVEKVIKISAETDEAVKDIQQLNKELNQTTKETDELSKGLIDSIKGFEVRGVSINSVSNALKLLKVSLVATGIGAIVVAVGSLAAAFLSTQEGVDKLNSVLTPLKEILATIWGIAQELGKGLFQMVSGDVIGGWNAMGKAVEDVGEKMEEAWKRGKKLHDLQLLIREDNLNMIKAEAQLSAQIEEQRFIAEDVTKSYKERKDALDLAIQSEDALYNLRKNSLQLKINELKLSQEANDTNAEGVEELIRLEAELISLNATRFSRQKDVRNQLNSLNEQYKTQEANKAQEAIATVTRQGYQELEIKQDFLDMEAEALKEHYLNKEFMAAEAAKKEEMIREITTQNQLRTAGNLFYALEQLADEDSVLKKAAGIGSVLVDAAAAIVGTWKGYSSFGPWGTAAAIAQTAAIGATALTSIKQITSVKKPSSKDLSGAPSTGGGGGVPVFNIVSASPTNQLNEALAANNAIPVKAYVVSSEVTSQAALDRRISNAASF